VNAAHHNIAPGTAAQPGYQSQAAYNVRRVHFMHHGAHSAPYCNAQAHREGSVGYSPHHPL